MLVLFVQFYYESLLCYNLSCDMKCSGVPFSHSAKLAWWFCALCFWYPMPPVLILLVTPWYLPEINWLRQHFAPYPFPLTIVPHHRSLLWVEFKWTLSKLGWQIQGNVELEFNIFFLVSLVIYLAGVKFQLERAWNLSTHPANCCIGRGTYGTDIQNHMLDSSFLRK